MAKIPAIPVVTIESSEGKRLIRTITRVRTAYNREIARTVEKVVSDVQAQGDRALFAYTRKFDKKVLTAATVRVNNAHIAAAAKRVSAPLKAAIQESAKRIRAFHRLQKVPAFSLTTAEGRLSQIVKPLDRVGVYIPGGYTTYPSTVLMDVIPAQIAGVREIAAVTPPRDALDPLIAYVLTLLKVREVYQIGGAQAVAALAYGTKSIAAVDKIVGPGNSYVAMAKKMVYGTVDIDSVAGPSEVAVLVDSSVPPAWVALDLLAQAEHGSGDETAVCVTEDARYARRIQQTLLQAIESSPVKPVFTKLSKHAIALFVSRDRDASIEFINTLAPEHLQIMTKIYRQDLKKIRNAPAIFCGPYTPVALGDYFIGTNHVLPTGSTARYASPLGVDSFLKRIAVAEVHSRGLHRAAPYVSRLARAEGFVHHALSVERRVENSNKDY